jgi:hypothetical protein
MAVSLAKIFTWSHLCRLDATNPLAIPLVLDNIIEQYWNNWIQSASNRHQQLEEYVWIQYTQLLRWLTSKKSNNRRKSWTLKDTSSYHTGNILSGRKYVQFLLKKIKHVTHFSTSSTEVKATNNLQRESGRILSATLNFHCICKLF